MTERSTTPRPHPMWFGLLAVVLLSINLRTAVSSVGSVLPELRDANQMNGFATGLLTSLPPFCFGILGLTGPAVARRIGLYRTGFAAILLIIGGQLVRAFIPGLVWLYLGSIVSLAAIALANVIMPSIIRDMFPHRVAGMTAVYSLAMSLAQALVSFVTIPLMHALGGDWRVGIGMWAALAVLALIPWIPLARPKGPEMTSGSDRLPLTVIARVPKAWALAFFMGSQSLGAYVAFGYYPTLLQDEGLSAQAAASQLGVVSIAATVATIFAPSLFSRMKQPSLMMWGFVACYVTSYVGLIFAPTTLTLLWSTLNGVGQTFFPIALYIVNLRARTHTGVLSLSGFMQPIGYIFAGTGLLLIGTIHGGSSDWTGVLIGMIVLSLILLVLALISARNWTIEDELDKRGLLPDALRKTAPDRST